MYSWLQILGIPLFIQLVDMPDDEAKKMCEEVKAQRLAIIVFIVLVTLYRINSVN